MKRTLAALSLVPILLVAGCTSPAPSAVERFLFTTITNYTPRVVSLTNVVGNEMTVTVQTNLTPVIEFTPSPQALAWSSAVASIADMFAPGVGKLTLLASTGALGVYGISRRRKLQDALAVADGHEADSKTYMTATETLAQTLEVFREVLKTTPQGQALNAKLTDLLVNNQMTAGVIREVATVVSATVNNEKAKRAAQMILDTLPAAPAPAT